MVARFCREREREREIQKERQKEREHASNVRKRANNTNAGIFRIPL